MCSAIDCADQGGRTRRPRLSFRDALRGCRLENRRGRGRPQPPRRAGSRPLLRRMGRSGDRGVVAIDESGRRVGAAWYRLFAQDDRGYGFVDEHTPEITMAVEPSARGRGLGEALMHALVAAAQQEGLRALSLSVEKDNVRALRIYTKLGFRRVGREDNAWTMLYSSSGF